MHYAMLLHYSYIIVRLHNLSHLCCDRGSWLWFPISIRWSRVRVWSPPTGLRNWQHTCHEFHIISFWLSIIHGVEVFPSERAFCVVCLLGRERRGEVERGDMGDMLTLSQPSCDNAMARPSREPALGTHFPRCHRLLDANCLWKNIVRFGWKMRFHRPMHVCYLKSNELT